MSKFKTVAMNWGCEHEKIAISEYLSTSLKRHHNFKVMESGFFISTDHPFIGASPDSLTVCTCCEGICEVKVIIVHLFCIGLKHVWCILVSLLSQARFDVRGCGRYFFLLGKV